MLAELQVGARLMVIAEIRGEGALQMAGIQDNEMVQTVSAGRSDEPLGIWILPRTSRRREHLFNTQPSKPLVNGLPVYSIPVADEIPMRIPLGDRLDDLVKRRRPHHKVIVA